jgi:hypothetical protein
MSSSSGVDFPAHRRRPGLRFRIFRKHVDRRDLVILSSRDKPRSSLHPKQSTPLLCWPRPYGRFGTSSLHSLCHVTPNERMANC